MQISPTGAVVRDSMRNLASGKAEICSLLAVDGKAVESSFTATEQATAGRGLQLQPRILGRNLPPGNYKADIECSTVFAAPVQSIFGERKSVRGVVLFSAVNGEEYVVQGNLEGSEAAVWIERHGKPVTEKVVVRKP
jgi:hypothetical protein